METERVVYQLVADNADLKRKLDSIQGEIRQTNNEFTRLSAGITRGFQVAGAAIAGLGISRVIRSLYEAGQSFQRIQNTLTYVTGSAAGAKEEFAFVSDTAKRLGLDLESVAGQYAQVAAASKGTAIEGATVKEIFLGIVEAGGALDLTAYQVEGALLAIQQMISKGTVNAEELRGQLGERLPGAFQVAARAMGVTTGELGKLLETGKLATNEFLPRFARQLRTEFGEAASRAAGSATSAINNFNTALYELKVEFAQSGFLDGLVSGLDGVREVIADPNFRQGLREFGEFVGTSLKWLVENASSLGSVTAALAAMKFTPGPLPLKLAAGAVAGVGTALYQNSGRAEALKQSIAAQQLRVDAARADMEASPDEASDAELIRTYDTQVAKLNELTRELAAVEQAQQFAADATSTAGKTAAAAAVELGKYTGANSAAEAALKKAAREAAQLAERRATALSDMQREVEQLTALRDAYISGSDGAVRLATKAAEIDEVLAGLEFKRSDELAQPFIKATLAAQNLKEEIEAISASDALKRQLADLEKLVKVSREHVAPQGPTWMLDPALGTAQDSERARSRAILAQEQDNALRELERRLRGSLAPIPENDALIQKTLETQRAINGLNLELSDLDLKNQQAIESTSRQLELLQEPAKNFLSSFQSEISNVFTGIADGTVDTWSDMLTSMKGLAARFIGDLAALPFSYLSLAAQKALTVGLGAYFGGGAGSVDGSAGSDTFTLAANAKGGAYDHGIRHYFAKGTVLTGPTQFRLADGMAVAGEAGPEAFLPLKRMSNGNLGVQASGSQGGVISLNVENRIIDQRTAASSAPVDTQSFFESGRLVLETIITDTTDNNLRRGRHDGAQRSRYGIRPTVGS